MRIDDWKQAGERFRFRQQNVFYREAGQGEALLCIHGFPTASWDWHLIWPELTQHFRTIAADMIGFGFSDKPQDFSYSILDQAALHESLLESLAIHSTHILAHDYGDTVAQELLARFEHRRQSGSAGLTIRSVCFLNGGLFPETHRPRLIQKLLLTRSGALIGRLVTEDSFRRSFFPLFGPDTRPSDQELQAFWSLIRYNDGPRVAHKVIQYMQERETHRERWVGVLQNTTVPLRLINGLRDPVSGEHMVKRYRELVPQPDIVDLENIGHYPQVEDPAGVLKAFIDFIEGLEKSWK